MKIKIIVVCVMLISFLAGCATNPVTGKSELQIMGSDWEANAGLQAAQEVEKEFANSNINPQLQSYVNSVGQKIAVVSHTPDLKFSFTAVP